MPTIRILLFPFAFLYKLITDLRNYLYDHAYKKSYQFDRYVISVGNLTVGGTGKTPFVELLIRMLKDKYKIAVLSRGYKRETKGFRLAGLQDNSNTLGDEPFQYFTKFGKQTTIAVGEDRASAIEQIIAKKEKTKIVILDDAYQHRKVRPQLNILLSDFYRPFYKDFVLPAGMLRESRAHAHRADMVIVTKCSSYLDKKGMGNIERQIRRYSGNSTPIYFTGIKYLAPQRITGTLRFSEDVILFTGIANPEPLKEYAEKHYNLLEHIKFPDHYAFTRNDIKEIIKTFQKINSEKKCLLTTEKDMVRLVSMKENLSLLEGYPVYYLPIELSFLENGDFFAKDLENKIVKSLTQLEIQ